MIAEGVVKTTGPRDCYDACGVLIYREAGRCDRIQGYDEGDRAVASGLKSKIISAVANVTPSPILAAVHRMGAKPGSGDR